MTQPWVWLLEFLPGRFVLRHVGERHRLINVIFKHFQNVFLKNLHLGHKIKKVSVSVSVFVGM